MHPYEYQTQKEAEGSQGLLYVYGKGSGIGQSARMVIGIGGMEVKNVGPIKVRELKQFKKLRPTSQVP